MYRMGLMLEDSDEMSQVSNDYQIQWHGPHTPPFALCDNNAGDICLHG